MLQQEARITGSLGIVSIYAIPSNCDFIVCYYAITMRQSYSTLPLKRYQVFGWVGRGKANHKHG